VFNTLCVDARRYSIQEFSQIFIIYHIIRAVLSTGDMIDVIFSLRELNFKAEDEQVDCRVIAILMEKGESLSI
jgi:hypothetical protein